MSKQNPGYTFVSISTAKPGQLEELAKIASEPTNAMTGYVEGLIAYQVSIDRERNAVVVWATFDRKETLYDYLQSPRGQANHGDEAQMAATIETFAMYDLTPFAQSL